MIRWHFRYLPPDRGNTDRKIGGNDHTAMKILYVIFLLWLDKQ
ncbi:hypothetical protein TGAM01_v205142 [Trichoderma gamsii]|uniref:Uncharacterized protein n=1 Tax=Trichoderma gamsii TaxID=398673 RepID=A0A2P4ZPJ4_9HYPO|nr:hypothetical protein TGAM01_v205142 [Trichoderma gamsii]PON26198.1 hypothetical protein TGAM01_v205142 [Trichoderma gamsii]